MFLVYTVSSWKKISLLQSSFTLGYQRVIKKKLSPTRGISMHAICLEDLPME